MELILATGNAHKAEEFAVLFDETINNLKFPNVILYYI